MRSILQIPVIFILKKLDLYSSHTLRKSSFLAEIGWFKSFREQEAIDYFGHPIPWMTYSAISFLDQRITKGMTIFEYGCGNSTLWWSNRVKSVICCEHDRQWYERFKEKILTNVELHQSDLKYGGLYSNKVDSYRNIFDIVVIDGRDRVNCAKNCLGSLKRDGVIVWDNTDRTDYYEGYNFLQKNGFRRLDFLGMGPINSYSWCTSVFYKSENCLKI